MAPGSYSSTRQKGGAQNNTGGRTRREANNEQLFSVLIDTREIRKQEQ